MTTTLSLPSVLALPPGFGRAFGRTTVFGFQRGVTVPLPGVAVRAYVPGSSTPWPDPLYAEEDATTPVAFPVATDATGAIALWGGEPGRVELECSAPGYGTQRVVLDLEPPPPADAGDPYPVYATDQDLADHIAAPDAHPRYLTPDEGDELYTPLAHTTALNPHDQYATDADLAAHNAALDPHGQYATDADLSAHVAAPDPHAVYLTQSEGDARYATIAGGAFTNPYPNPMVFQASVAGLSFSQNGKAVLDTDHTAAADPHAIYLTQAEADGRYALASALTALTTRVATLETQVATLTSQMTGHTHASGTVQNAGGTTILP